MKAFSKNISSNALQTKWKRILNRQCTKCIHRSQFTTIFVNNFYSEKSFVGKRYWVALFRDNHEMCALSFVLTFWLLIYYSFMVHWCILVPDAWCMIWDAGKWTRMKQKCTKIVEDVLLQREENEAKADGNTLKTNQTEDSMINEIEIILAKRNSHRWIPIIRCASFGADRILCTIFYSCYMLLCTIYYYIKKEEKNSNSSAMAMCNVHELMNFRLPLDRTLKSPKNT